LAGSLSDAACQPAITALDSNEAHFEGLTVASILKKLRHRGSADPIGAIDDPLEHSMLAQILLAESEPISVEHVTAALDTLRHRYLERRQRELRAAITDAERKGDSVAVMKLTAEKLGVDRELRG